jgi:hypothetical protein
MDTYIIWWRSLVDSTPGGLKAFDAMDDEDWGVIRALDPAFEEEDDYAETVYSPNRAMIVLAEVDTLQALQAAGDIRGFAPRFA